MIYQLGVHGLAMRPLTSPLITKGTTAISITYLYFFSYYISLFWSSEVSIGTIQKKKSLLKNKIFRGWLSTMQKLDYRLYYLWFRRVWVVGMCRESLQQAKALAFHAWHWTFILSTMYYHQDCDMNSARYWSKKQFFLHIINAQVAFESLLETPGTGFYLL